MNSLIFLVSLVAAQSPIYGQCNPSNYAQKAVANKDFPIFPALTQSGIVISGNFYIIDGCTFGLRNYTGYNFHQTKIYGGFPGSTDSMLLSNSDLTFSSVPTTLQFTLRSDAGAQANFGGFSEVRFFEVNLNTVIATVTLPSVSTTGSGSSTTGSGSDSKSSASIVDAMGSVLAIVSGLLFL